jgi:hypothetical protein
MTAISSAPAFMTVAKSNLTYFPEASNNDLVIGIHQNTQRILFGVSDSPSILQISNSNIQIAGTMKAQMIAVGGQIIGTGTDVVFSPIAPGFKIIDEGEGTGVGIGQERIQLQSGFLQWANTTTMLINPDQTISNSLQYLYFAYDQVSGDEKDFTKNALAFTGKYISQDFVLINDSLSIVLTGPSGMFCLGFDFISTNLKQFDETITFRCYYNKKTSDSIFQNYYSIKGSQFINIMLPSYSTLQVIFNPADNPGNSLSILDSSINLRITRLSIIET